MERRNQEFLNHERINQQINRYIEAFFKKQNPHVNNTYYLNEINRLKVDALQYEEVAPIALKSIKKIFDDYNEYINNYEQIKNLLRKLTILIKERCLNNYQDVQTEINIFEAKIQSVDDYIGMVEILMNVIIYHQKINNEHNQNMSARFKSNRYKEAEKREEEEEEIRKQEEEEIRKWEEEFRKKEEEETRKKEEEETLKKEEDETRKKEEEFRKRAEEETRKRQEETSKKENFNRTSKPSFEPNPVGLLYYYLKINDSNTKFSHVKNTYRKSWREWIRKNHPDKNGNEEDTKEMIAIGKYYEWCN